MLDCVRAFVRLGDRATRRLRRALTAGVLLGLCAACALAQPATADPPAAATPRWTEADIRASRIETADAALPQRPSWNADPMKLLVVVEAGDAHVSLVDGERFETLHRFRSREALRGAPRFSPEGRYAYFGSHDGWISRYDLWNLRLVAEVRAGSELRHLAISRDGRWLMAAHAQPPTLLLFDAGLNLVKTWAAASRDGQTRSRVAAVLDAAPRRSFIVALQDIAELWEISYDPKAEDFYDGLVHDYRMGEGLPVRGFLNPRRSFISEPLESVFFDPVSTQVAGTARAKDGGGASAQWVNLDVRRRIASLPLAGAPQPGSGTAFDWNGRRVLALPNPERAAIDVIDLRTWQPVKTIATPGPGSFVRSHDGSRYAWADAMMGADTDATLTVIDKQTLEPVAQLRQAGHSPVHVEFTQDGRHALVSVRGPQGALIVHDATTRRQVKRLPMRGPAASYNVGNQLERPDPGRSP